jgi:hypothetical protein
MGKQSMPKGAVNMVISGAQHVVDRDAESRCARHDCTEHWIGAHTFSSDSAGALERARVLRISAAAGAWPGMAMQWLVADQIPTRRARDRRRMPLSVGPEPVGLREVDVGEPRSPSRSRS